MRSPTCSTQLGYEGEVIVAELLPGCIPVNDGTRLPKTTYDIFWEDIKIDVKSCKRGGNSPSWSESNVRRTRKDDVVYVLLFRKTDDNTLHFWVRHTGQRFMNNAHVSTGIGVEKLQTAIIACHKKYSPMYKKTVDKVQLVI